MRHLPAILLLVFLPLIPISANTIVVVNFQTVFEEYRELQRLDRSFRSEVETFQAEQQQAVQALQQKQQEFNALRQQAAKPEVTDEERETFAEQAAVLLEELNNEQQRLQQERQTFQQELEAKGLRLRRGIVEDVREKIETFAIAQGWDLVLDASATSPNGLPMINYSNPEMEKTRWVITELNNAFMESAGEE